MASFFQSLYGQKLGSFCKILFCRFAGRAVNRAFPANGFGLYDVVGNVWQWTADCWYRDYSTAPLDGSARDDSGCPKRVLRGGSWDNDAWMARLSYRGGAAPTLRQDINGFRIAKSVD